MVNLGSFVIFALVSYLFGRRFYCFAEMRLAFLPIAFACFVALVPLG
jgi:hypothetical protein